MSFGINAKTAIAAGTLVGLASGISNLWIFLHINPEIERKELDGLSVGAHAAGLGFTSALDGLRTIPVLGTYLIVRLWHAGCATGEEVHSMAILLAEADLLARSQIYATDYHRASLETGRRGIYPARAHHNLAVDGSFGEMNLVVCRNVLIYFDVELQDRVLRLSRQPVPEGPSGARPQGIAAAIERRGPVRAGPGSTNLHRRRD